MRRSRCLNPYQLNPCRGARFNRHISLSTLKVLSNQGDKLVICLAINRRRFQLCSPSAVGLLYEQRATGIRLYFDTKDHCEILVAV
jgi:hypothetical protein